MLVVLWLTLSYATALRLTAQLLPVYEKTSGEAVQAAKVVLDGTAQQVVDTQGMFTLYGVTQGLHLLELSVLHQDFPTLLLEVREEVVHVMYLHDRHRTVLEAEDVLEIRSLSLVSVYEIRPETSYLRLLLSPLSLMMVVALLASYLAPKRVIDEEQLQELRQITKEMEAEKGKDWVDTLLQMLDPED
jgi:hypothetical protein